MKSFKIPVIDQQGEIRDTKPVPVEIFGAVGSSVLVSQAVKRFLANQRKAKAKTKTRSGVVGSGAKIWRQKGTGRARHGDRKAPIFVGGGVAHGPTGEQNYKQRMNQKMSQKAIFSILSEKAMADRLFLLDDLTFDKTKQASLFVKELRKNLKTDEKISFLLTKDENLKKYLNNLDEVCVLGVNSLNPYFLLKTDFLLLTKGALEELKKRTESAKDSNANRS